MVVTRGTVLITDDERLIRWSIVQRLQQCGFRGIEAVDARECLQKVRDADAVILDYRLPDRSGFEVLRELRRSQPHTPVIMLTAHASVEHAVEAMKLGAFHYVAKPFDLDEIVMLLEDALRRSRARAAPPPVTAEALLGSSPAIQEVRRLISRVAASRTSTVLITGESGTGKDLAARAIHGESARRDGPYVNITCSAIPEHLLESELFGHERGAFTDARSRRIGLIEQADGGTLFLDEIGEMPLAMQAKLLRFLEDRAFRRVGGTDEIRPDVRVVAATNVDLEDAVRRGTFREDLFYRLAVVRVRVPPLRERLEDLPTLVAHFVSVFARELGREARVSPEALEALARQPWPGNVRELRNAIERALLLSESEVLGVSELGLDEARSSAPPEPEGAFQLPNSGVDIEELERSLLVQALERAGGNQRRAGEMLGMNRDQVRYRMAKYGIPSRRAKRGE
ncbi:MAG TPA: sigma-54 dependent transcriptional regulator, partial [Sandaracinaceae bacterium]